jgi:TetR/AcrR family transcriptional repressor of nem operon
MRVEQMKQDAKERVLETGAAIVHRKGFHNTGIQEVLKAAEIPKGSFYFYFTANRPLRAFIFCQDG